MDGLIWGVVRAQRKIQYSIFEDQQDSLKLGTEMYQYDLIFGHSSFEDGY